MHVLLHAEEMICLSCYDALNKIQSCFCSRTRDRTLFMWNLKQAILKYVMPCLALHESKASILLSYKKTNGGNRTALQIAIRQDRLDLVKSIDSFGYYCILQYSMTCMFQTDLFYAVCYGSFQVFCEYFLQTFPFYNEEIIFRAAFRLPFVSCYSTTRRIRLNAWNLFAHIQCLLSVQQKALMWIWSECCWIMVQMSMLKERVSIHLFMKLLLTDTSRQYHTCCNEEQTVCEMKSIYGVKPFRLECYACFAERGYPLVSYNRGHQGTDISFR